MLTILSQTTNNAIKTGDLIYLQYLYITTMPIEGKKSLTLYSSTIGKLGKEKKYGETWDEYLLYLLYKSGRVEESGDR